MIVIPGNYPRSERLIQKTRDFDRNRIEYKDLQKELEREFDEFLSFQELIGTPFYSTGLFNYQDLVRPFSVFIQNSQANTLVRFEETNVFWRKLEVTKPVKINEENFDKFLIEYLRIDKMKNYNYLVSLPSVLTLTKYSNLEIEGSMELLTEISTKIIEKWHQISSKSINFAFLEYTEIQDVQYIVNFSLRLSQIDKNSKVRFFVFFKNRIDNIQENISKLKNTNLSGMSINFYLNPLKKISDISMFNNFEYLFAGIINTNTTLIEDIEKVQDFIQHLRKSYRNNLCITDDFYAELLPREVMDQKIKNLLKIPINS
ncbi:MAG: hypothetical protein RMJ51_03285 [Candidatus Calescibacterium sp.]|nr:hypothetical protein [Candidatus Calescibacterium sp.]MCX7972828.1 hypothetical protein [bacterium]MDW8195250.1 hypothetical protein [Candidatus Calescibacterium sp.]